MRECGLIGFDLGACAWGIVSGWAGMVPWWVWALVALVVIGIVWKVAGWPGLLALAAGVGFILGRRSAREAPDEIWPDPDPKPVRVKPRRTLRDVFADWRDR